MQAVTITQITPEELESLIERVLIKVLKNQKEKSSTDDWMDLNELCAYLPDKPAKATVYAWVSSRFIPHNKGSKKLRFSKSEINEWLKSGRKKTIDEIKDDAMYNPMSTSSKKYH